METPGKVLLFFSGLERSKLAQLPPCRGDRAGRALPWGQAPSWAARRALSWAGAGSGGCRAGGREERRPHPGRVGPPAAVNILPLSIPAIAARKAQQGQAGPQQLPGRGTAGSRSHRHAAAEIPAAALPTGAVLQSRRVTPQLELNAARAQRSWHSPAQPPYCKQLWPPLPSYFVERLLQPHERSCSKKPSRPSVGPG